METNEKGQRAQHGTGKHPEPSEDVQADIETVTPDTENPGQEEVNKHKTKDNGYSEPEQKEEKADVDDEQQESDQEEGQDDAQPDNTDDTKGDDEGDDIETVSP
ncbi:hypothetical protein [Arcticibacter eurypsychrophilus]|uniref:hypothetical protein n=1 Tax=Arcticibacter eurypsychrophilus TaxID=1434752 RepID=UPI00084D7418|nr:hypothetical protein [Arcticibacter eurypsychrophilus]